MSKKVKKVILGVKVAEKLVENRNIDKICDMIREEKFDSEAVRFILDNVNSFSPFGNILDRSKSPNNPYTFGSIYGCFEDYVSSGLAKFLYNESESGEYIRWFDIMPESSEALIELYNSSSDDVKKIIFKTLVYRRRSMDFPLEAVKNYTNCFDAIVEISKDCLSMGSLHELYQYIVRWSWVIDKNNLKKVESIIGEEATKLFVSERIEYRYCYDKTDVTGYEISELYSYLKEAGQDLRYEVLLSTMNFIEWGRKTRDEGNLFAFCKKAYNLFLSDRIKDKVEDMDRKTIADISRYIYIIMAYEDNEDKKNALFQLGVKIRGYEQFVGEMCYAGKCSNINYALTPEMVKLSKIFTRSFEYLLLDKKISNAEELISLKESWFPHSSIIGDFDDNPFVYNNLKLEAFSEDDIQKISRYLNWKDCRGYFKGGIIPTDFLIKYGNKMSDNCIAYSIIYSDLQASEIISLLKKFESRLSNNEKNRIASSVLSKKGGATAEEIATVLKIRDHSKLIDLDYIHEDHNASLQSILTLL